MSVLQLGLTLAAIAWLPGNALKLAALLALWALTFRPRPTTAEWGMVAAACIVFTTMNALALRQGIFRFADPDLLGMPIYELPMWGFYLLHTRRALGGPPPHGKIWPALAFALLFALPFALLSDPDQLLAASSALLLGGLALFGGRRDAVYAGYMVLLGAAVEYTGVLSGQWSYPGAPSLTALGLSAAGEGLGLAGVPFWFAPMWGGVGLVLHRLVLPLMARREAQRQQPEAAPAFFPSGLVDAYIRHRAAVHRTPMERFQVRVARTIEEHRAAFRLLRAGYVFQGLESVDEAAQLRITQHHVLPESTILVAYEGDRLVGTMTVVEDSPAGLPLDRDFPQELAALRRQGARLVEYGSLTVVRRCWREGVTQLLAMAAHWLTEHLHGATHVVVGMNPRALPLYRALYCFHPRSAPKPHLEFPAPVQLLVQSVDEVIRHYQRHMRRPMSTGLRFEDHARVALPPCIELPDADSIAELVRWKLPRDVFRQLFIHETHRLETLDANIRDRLYGWRSLQTTKGSTEVLSIAGEAA